jgi:hypothetical protein
MDSPMLTKLKNKNPGRAYPANLGKKWTTIEEEQLLKEIYENVDIECIASIHKRTVGGICARRYLIVIKMYDSKISIEDIEKITKLNQGKIMEIILIKYPNLLLENKVSKLEKELENLKFDFEKAKLSKKSFTSL